VAIIYSRETHQIRLHTEKEKCIRFLLLFFWFWLVIYVSSFFFIWKEWSSLWSLLNHENNSICLDDVKAATCAAENPCSNGGTCIDQPFMCICTPQWTGSLCDFPTCKTILTVNKVFESYFKLNLILVQSIHVWTKEYVFQIPSVVFVCICSPKYRGSFYQTLNSII
jgi:hypothetical protein